MEPWIDHALSRQDLADAFRLRELLDEGRLTVRREHDDDACTGSCDLLRCGVLVVSVAGHDLAAISYRFLFADREVDDAARFGIDVS